MHVQISGLAGLFTCMSKYLNLNMVRKTFLVKHEKIMCCARQLSQCYHLQMSIAYTRNFHAFLNNRGLLTFQETKTDHICLIMRNMLYAYWYNKGIN